jgi:hypothetical protein
LNAHPGQQFGQRERLGQVVLGAALQAVDLGRDVGDARQHDDRLLRVRGEQPAEHLPPVQVWHHEVKDDQLVVGLDCAAQPFGAAVREFGRIAGGSERPADERADLRLVIDDQDAPQMPHGHLPGYDFLLIVSMCFPRVNRRLVLITYLLQHCHINDCKPLQSNPW